MIKDYLTEEKITPKQKAQEILASKLTGAFYSDTWEEAGMTENEIALISEQIEKIVNRLERSLGNYRA